MRILLFVICILISWSAVSALSYLIFRRGRNISPGLFVTVFDPVAAAAFAYLSVTSGSWITWHANMFLVSLYLVFLANTAVNMIRIAVPAAKKASVKIKMLLSLSATVALAVYGIANMQIVIPCEHNLSSDKLSEDHKFAVITDLHAGSAQPMKTVRKTLASVKNEAPEFLVLAGDITDEFSSKEIMEAVYEAVGELDIPVYFVYGNHDRQNRADKADGASYTEAELETAILKNGILILRDTAVEIGCDLTLLGREDAENACRLQLSELPETDPSRYLIVVDHQPYRTDEIIAGGADIQISGHSHAGQYFPLEQLYDLAGYDSYGEYVYGNTTLIVGAGASGWRTPFRTARHSSYEIVLLSCD